MADSESRHPGLQIHAGDKVYIPAGGLQIWVNPDGTAGVGASIAVDPWLPDLSVSTGTPAIVIEGIARKGFSVSSICTGQTINACQKARDVRELLAYPGVARLKHMAVIDGTNALGILDLDKARGQVRHSSPEEPLLVEEIYEPANAKNTVRADDPLIDYILTADKRPFRLVELPGNKLGTVDVEDLQKVPVRALLFMHFVQLEDMLVRSLSSEQPQLLRQEYYEHGIDADPLGNSGAGPVRKVETYSFGSLLRSAIGQGVLNLHRSEVSFLERYRNYLAHGPRWYITRRSDVAPLVNCVKRVLELIREVDAEGKK